MRIKLWLTLLLCVSALTLLVSCAPVSPTATSSGGVVNAPGPSPEKPVLRIGHNWSGDKLKALEAVVDDYQEQHPTLELVLQADFTHEQILASLHAGIAPDIFIATHDFGGELFQQGYLSAYCAEDQCSECTGPNPPLWCWYAMGNFGPEPSLPAEITGPFSNKLGLCLEPCEVCQSPNPPIWCWFARGDVGYPDVDFFEAAFAKFDGDKLFPFGRPVDFWADLVLGNSEWFRERGLDMPKTVEQLNNLAVEFSSDQPFYYSDPTLADFMPSGLKDLGVREQVDGAGIIVTNSTALAYMDREISGRLVPLDVEGLPPRIWIEGAYLNPLSTVKTYALDFMYQLSEPGVQNALFQQAGVLPVASDLLAKLADATTLGQAISLAGSTGQLATAPPPTNRQVCVDFQGYADDTQMGMTFQVGGLTFTGLGTPEPFVNDIDVNVHGLQFSEAGIQIDMSAPATTISLVAGSWTGQPLDVVALDSSGNPVDQTMVPGDNSVHPLMLTGQDIASLIITGGGGEGVLVEICVNGKPQPPSVCVDFEPPVTAGTQYGRPGGQNPGDVLFTSNGIPVAVYENGSGTFNVATIETSSGLMSQYGITYGQGQVVNTNNINLAFDFSGLGFQPREVTADFLDMGGVENLSVNGITMFVGELAAATVPTGLTIGVSTTPVTGGKTGTVTIAGPVNTLHIGGQEFWLDNVCARG